VSSVTYACVFEPIAHAERAQLLETRRRPAAHQCDEPGRNRCDGKDDVEDSGQYERRAMRAAGEIALRAEAAADARESTIRNGCSAVCNGSGYRAESRSNHAVTCPW